MTTLTVDWGDIATWVQSLLTGGSLLLGFYILLRDRRKEERRQVERVVVDGGVSLPSPVQGVVIEPGFYLSIWNNSDQPIFNPVALGPIAEDADDGVDDPMRVQDDDSGEFADMVMPGDWAYWRGTTPRDGVVFRDVRNRYWAMDWNGNIIAMPKEHLLVWGTIDGEAVGHMRNPWREPVPFLQRIPFSPWRRNIGKMKMTRVKQA